MGYVSRMFRYWRGGIEVRLRFAKTDFHSGRLVVVYAPTTLNVTFANSPYYFREILDIRDKDEVCFTLPYVHSIPWLRTGEGYGKFCVFVQSPLACPPSVDTSMDIIFEVRGAQDLQFGLPSTRHNVPFEPQSGGSGDGVTEERMMKCESIGGSSLVPYDDQVQHTMGECCMSLLQLVKRYSRIFFTTTPSGEPTPDQGFMYPFALGASRHVTGAPSQGAVSGDALSLIAPLYAFWRGGVRIKCVTTTNSNVIVAGLVAPAISPNDSGAYLSTDADNTSNGTLVGSTTHPLYVPHAPSPNNTMNGFSVSVPAYTATRFRNVVLASRFQAANDRTSSQSYLNSSADVSLVWTQIPKLSSGTSGIFYRAAGDDVQFGMFLSTVPITVSVIPV